MAGIRLAHKDFIISKDVTNTLQFDNIFSQRFSMYEILGHNLKSSYGQQRDWLNMTLLGADGSVLSGTDYYSHYNYIHSNGTTKYAGNEAGVSDWRFARHTEDSFGTNFRAVIHTPYESNRITSFQNTVSSNNSSNLHFFETTGVYRNNTAITGFRLFGETYEVIGGNISVFGIGG